MAKSRRLSQTLRYAAEAAVVGFFSSLGRFIPAALAPRLGAGLGRLAARLDGRRRRVAIDNLRASFEGMSESEARKTAVSYYAHLGRGYFEMQVMQRRAPKTPLAHWVSMEAADERRVQGLIDKYGSVLFVTCHGGAWELMGARMTSLGIDLHVVFRPMANPWLNRRLLAFRESLGVGLIPYNLRALAGMQRCLRKGQCVAILADLNQKHGGVFADFFGRPAATSRAPGLLAVRREVPVICGYTYHTGEPYRYHAYCDEAIYPPESGSTDERVLYVTQEINKSIERFVRAHPTQWQWNYKRWKTQPSGVEA